MTQPIRDILLELKHDTENLQTSITHALNTLDGQELGEKPMTTYGRRLERARTGILGGWWKLEPVMLDVEFDLLGIAHTDRFQLVAEYQREQERNRARETTEATHA